MKILLSLKTQWCRREWAVFNAYGFHFRLGNQETLNFCTLPSSDYPFSSASFNLQGKWCFWLVFSTRRHFSAPPNTKPIFSLERETQNFELRSVHQECFGWSHFAFATMILQWVIIPRSFLSLFQKKEAISAIPLGYPLFSQDYNVSANLFWVSLSKGMVVREGRSIEYFVEMGRGFSLRLRSAFPYKTRGLIYPQFICPSKQGFSYMRFSLCFCSSSEIERQSIYSFNDSETRIRT